MKKSLLLLVFAIAFCFPKQINAQTCKIQGTYDTIEVFSSSYDAESGTINVTVSSDSSTPANLTITVEVTYEDSFQRITTNTYAEKFLAKPGQSTICKVSVPNIINKNGIKYNYSSYTIKSLTGVKCE